MAVVIELDIEVIDDSRIAGKIVDFIEALPRFTPEQYDLNQRGTPRKWDRELAIVDMLTQRTQLFSVDDVVLVATGKHGEPPTIAINRDIDDHTLKPLLKPLPVAAVRR